MDGRLRSLSVGTLSSLLTLISHGETKMQVVVKLIRYHEHGNLIMYLKIPRNPVQDYMAQAAQAASPYLSEGWHMVQAYIE
jgi:hypothetical protein